MKHDEGRDILDAALESLRDVPSSDPARRDATREMFLGQAAQMRRNFSVSNRPLARHKWWKALYRQRRFRMPVILAVILLVTAAAGGTVAAADASVPGGPLYGLDRAIENERANLINDPTAQAEYQLKLAAERLDEAQATAAQGDNANAAVALAGYGDAIAEAAQAVGGEGGADADALADLLDAALAVHSAQLDAIGVTLPAEAQDAGPPVDPGPPSVVSGGQPEGLGDGPPEGAADGPLEGAADGPPEGAADGPPEGASDGQPDSVSGDVIACDNAEVPSAGELAERYSVAPAQAQALLTAARARGASADAVHEVFCGGFDFDDLVEDVQGLAPGGPPIAVPAGPPA